MANFRGTKQSTIPLSERFAMLSSVRAAQPPPQRVQVIGPGPSSPTKWNQRRGGNNRRGSGGFQPASKRNVQLVARLAMRQPRGGSPRRGPVNSRRGLGGPRRGPAASRGAGRGVGQLAAMRMAQKLKKRSVMQRLGVKARSNILARQRGAQAGLSLANRRGRGRRGAVGGSPMAKLIRARRQGGAFGGLAGQRKQRKFGNALSQRLGPRVAPASSPLRLQPQGSRGGQQNRGQRQRLPNRRGSQRGGRGNSNASNNGQAHFNQQQQSKNRRGMSRRGRGSGRGRGGAQDSVSKATLDLQMDRYWRQSMDATNANASS